MNTPSLSGRLVRLAVINTEDDLEQWAGWLRNSEYPAIFSMPIQPNCDTPAQIKEWLEKELGDLHLVRHPHPGR